MFATSKILAGCLHYIPASIGSYFPLWSKTCTAMEKGITYVEESARGGVHRPVEEGKMTVLVVEPRKETYLMGLEDDYRVIKVT